MRPHQFSCASGALQDGDGGGRGRRKRHSNNRDGGGSGGAHGDAPFEHDAPMHFLHDDAREVVEPQGRRGLRSAAGTEGDAAAAGVRVEIKEEPGKGEEEPEGEWGPGFSVGAAEGSGGIAVKADEKGAVLKRDPEEVAGMDVD